MNQNFLYLCLRELLWEIQDLLEYRSFPPLSMGPPDQMRWTQIPDPIVFLVLLRAWTKFGREKNEFKRETRWCFFVCKLWKHRMVDFSKRKSLFFLFWVFFRPFFNVLDGGSTPRAIIIIITGITKKIIIITGSNLKTPYININSLFISRENSNRKGREKRLELRDWWPRLPLLALAEYVLPLEFVNYSFKKVSILCYIGAFGECSSWN